MKEKIGKPRIVQIGVKFEKVMSRSGKYDEKK